MHEKLLNFHHPLLAPQCRSVVAVRPCPSPPAGPPLARSPDRAVCRFAPCRRSRATKLLDERDAIRAALLYKKAERKAARHPAPHGYGDGYFECPCARCKRAMLLQEAVERAHRAWVAAQHRAWVAAAARQCPWIETVLG